MTKSKNTKKDKKISIQTDHFFKIMFDAEIATQVCKTYMDESVKRLIDWSTFQPYNKLSTEHQRKKFAAQKIDDNAEPNTQLATFTRNIADAAFIFQYHHLETNSKRDAFLIIHAEAQSTPDELMPVRTLNYMSNLLIDYSETKQTNILPPVAQYVFYNGKISPYPHSLDIITLFSDPALAIKFFAKPRLIDLSIIPDSELITHGCLSPIEIAIKHIYDKSKQAQPVDYFIQGIEQHINHTPNHTHSPNRIAEKVNNMVQFVLDAWDVDVNYFLDKFKQQLPQYEDLTMNMSQQLKQQGMQQGVQQGVQQRNIEIARNMLANREPVEKVMQYTGLPKKELNNLDK